MEREMQAEMRRKTEQVQRQNMLTGAVPQGLQSVIHFPGRDVKTPKRTPRVTRDYQ